MSEKRRDKKKRILRNGESQRKDGRYAYKYYDNAVDGAENPFWYTPQRSPMDNLMVRIGVAYRFAPEFKSWTVKRQKREKMKAGFDFGEKPQK